MASVKHDRIQEQIKELASQIILFQLKDPRLGFITVTRVDLSPDMRAAKVYYSVLGTDVDTRLTARAIQHARGHVQREVAKHIKLRFAPIISFEFDDSPRKSIELSKLIDKAVAEDEQRRKETGREGEEGKTGGEEDAGTRGRGEGEAGRGGEEGKTGGEKDAGTRGRGEGEAGKGGEEGKTGEPDDMLDKADELQEKADELRAKADELRGKGMEDQAAVFDDQADELEDQAGDLEGEADELEDEAADLEDEADELEGEVDSEDDEERRDREPS